MNSSERKQNMEKSMLLQFKVDLKEHLTEEHNDEVIYKWLRAKNFDLDKAELLFRQNLACRQIYGHDKMPETYEPPEVARKYSFLGFLGFAKDGTPVRYISMGKGDYIGFLMSMSIYDICYFSIWILEKDKKAMKKNNELNGFQHNEISYILDMDGFTLQQTAYRAVMETAWDMSRILQDYYPEIWKRVFFVNAPPYFHTIFNVIKPIFRSTLLDKIQVLSKENTANELLKYIDPNVLPAFLGGNRVDANGDPKCSEFITFGGKIPEQYYLRNNFSLEPGEPGVECIIVRPRSFFNYPVIVPEGGTTLYIQAQSDTGPINGIMVYKKFSSKIEESHVPESDEVLDENNVNSGIYLVSPEVKWQLHLAPTNNKCLCPWPGIYILRFGNTFNWFQTKKIFVRIQLIPPNAEAKKITYKFPF